MQRRIRQTAVIGSGIMGGGIAALLAAAGIKVLLLDIIPFDLKDDEKSDPEKRNRIVQAGLDAALKANPPLFMNKKTDAPMISIGNLEDDIHKLSECDWIIEVVVENLKIKQDLLRRIEGVKKPGAVVSSNTSGIPLKDMSKGLGEEMRRHFLGIHFFNPVRYMHLLEIIPGEDTLPEIVDFMSRFGEIMLGKGIVRAKDTPNFIGNRIGIQGIGKAMQAMPAHDISIPEADVLFGASLGRPRTAIFKTSDLVGLDTMLHVSRNCYDFCPDDEMRETLKVPDFVTQMVEKKQLGDKTNGGFYKKELTPEWQIIRKVVNPATGEYEEFQRPSFPCIEAAEEAKTLPEKIRSIVYSDDKGSRYAWDVIANGLIYAVNRIPEIADTIVDIDHAMKWGYNWELGPFETWDAMGVETAVKKMEADGLTVPEKVNRMTASGATSFYKLENGKKMFYDFASGSYKNIPTNPKAVVLSELRANNNVVKTSASCSLIDLGDEVFCLEFHSKMNAINKEMVDFMLEAGDYVLENGAGLVIGNQASGMPAPFSAGGDLSYMLGLAKSGRFDEINDFVADVHRAVMATKYSPFPVVAAPFGLTLGGGCEVCMAADRIVAHADLFMGLVEIGAGLVPGGCGMIHLWRNYIDSVPEAASITDLSGLFLQAFMCVAQAKVSTSAADARKNGFLRPFDRIVFNKDNLIGEAKKEVLKLSDDGYTPPKKKKITVFGREAHGMIWAEMNNMRQGGYLPAHMELIAKKAAFCMSGGDVPQRTPMDEEYLMALERKAFVDLWKTENTQKMAEHMMTKGKPLFL